MSAPNRAKELQERIEKGREELLLITAGLPNVSPQTRIIAIQCDILVAASQLEELSTRRIMRLTWLLAVLTAGLLLTAVGAFFG